MKFSDTRESKYLKQSDVKQPTKVTIANFTIESVGQGAEAENRVICYFARAKKGMVVNTTNQATLEELFHTDETDEMIGKQVVIWTDPSIMFGTKRTGGLRFMDTYQINQHFGATAMTPAAPTAPSVPAAAPSMPPADGPMAGEAPSEASQPIDNTADDVFGAEPPSNTDEDPFMSGQV